MRALGARRRLSVGVALLLALPLLTVALGWRADPDAPGRLAVAADSQETISAGIPADKARVFVTFAPDFDGDGSFADEPEEQAAEAALVAGYGGSVRYRFQVVDAVAVELDAQQLPDLTADPRVLAVEPDGVASLLEHTTTPGDSELNNAWGVKHVGAGPAHDAGIRGAGVLVGVIDTGVNTAHGDLTDNYDAACSYDLVNGDSDPNDEHGHGSHVSGIIAAADNGSGVVGMAPDASLCVYKVAGATGTANWSDVVAALDRAVTDGVQVLNLSLGDDVYPGDSVADAFTEAYGAGLVLVAAAGNQGTCAGTGDNLTWPGRFPETIAVAALDDGDISACFSSTGAKVELSAPGVDVYSAWIGGAATFAFYTGTSMAAPHVSGLAALLRGCTRTLTNEQVRAILDTSAKDLNSPLVPGFPDGRDTWHGFGLIQTRAALAASGCANLPPPATATPTSTAAATRTPATSTVVALATSTPRPRQTPPPPPAVGGISMEPGAALFQTRSEAPPAVYIAVAAAALTAGVATGVGVIFLRRQRGGR